jgi:hypothetical protein
VQVLHPIEGADAMSRIQSRRARAPSPADRAAGHDVAVAAEPTRRVSFVSFSFTSTELTTRGGRTRVRSRQVTFEDGRLSQASFEGTLGEQVFDDAVRDAQRRATELFGAMFAPFAWLLGTPKRRDRGD